MGSPATVDAARDAVVAGLDHDDPIVRLLATQVRLHAGRVAELEVDNERLSAQVARQGEQIKRLQGRLEEARRAGKRQAAPFSKGIKKTDPARPGRKPGADYGPKARRQPPPPQDVDEVIDVPAPSCCPGCGGDVVIDDVITQHQEEIVPASTRLRAYRVALGRCTGCKRRVRNRHPDQTSDATGAAGVMLGPVAHAMAAWLHTGLGVPMGKVSQVLQRLCGLRVTPGGLHSGLHRSAADATSTYQALIKALRRSGAVAADETGWRIDAERGWLWVYVGDTVTIYDIAPGRGFCEAERILGGDFDGVIERDGWAPYRKFTAAAHQTCLAHLHRRCHELIADAYAGQAKVPHALKRILDDALAVRDDGPDGEQLAAAIAQLTSRIEAFCARQPTHEPNRKLVAHIRREADHLLTFLSTPGVAATNHRAEQAIRPMVVNRKNWGGNKTRRGADTTAILASVMRTATQQHLDPIDTVATIRRTSRPPPGLDLTPTRPVSP